MKKLFYTLAVLFVCTLSANAQKAHKGFFRTIPSYFTYDHNPYIVFLDEDYVRDAEICDLNLNKVKTINVNSEVEYIQIERYVDKNGIGQDVKVDDIYLTQTFFNDDADWEYMVPVKGKVTDKWGYTYDDVVAYTIKKADGTVLGAISAAQWGGDVYVINDVVYAVKAVYGEDEVTTYYFYTLPEFRKLISNDPNGVKAVPAMVRTSKSTHDIAGRQVSESHKGVVIKDGKKMIAK